MISLFTDTRNKQIHDFRFPCFDRLRFAGGKSPTPTIPLFVITACTRRKLRFPQHGQNARDRSLHTLRARTISSLLPETHRTLPCPHAQLRDRLELHGQQLEAHLQQHSLPSCSHRSTYLNRRIPRTTDDVVLHWSVALHGDVLGEAGER